MPKLSGERSDYEALEMLAVICLMPSDHKVDPAGARLPQRAVGSGAKISNNSISVAPLDALVDMAAQIQRCIREDPARSRNCRSHEGRAAELYVGVSWPIASQMENDTRPRASARRRPGVEPYLCSGCLQADLQLDAVN